MRLVDKSASPLRNRKANAVGSFDFARDDSLKKLVKVKYE